jgi:capsular polysaccharide transport system permease protein
MITKPKAARFFLRRVERPAVPPAPPAPSEPALPFAADADGFEGMDFRPPDKGPAAPAAQAPTSPTAANAAALQAIAAEGLTRSQLRQAAVLAQRQGLQASSEVEAVLRLRQAGIDPFAGAPVLEVVPQSTPPDGTGSDAAPPGPAGKPAPTAAAPVPAAPKAEAGRAVAKLPGDQVQLPQKAKPIAVPAPDQRAETSHATEIQRMQRDIARRRRKKMLLLFARMFVFVLLPTMFAGWYFYRVATPIYSTKTEFVIQQAGSSAGPGMGGLSGLFSGTGLATAQDSIAVQGYLQSREAMLRLEEDLGFREHFQSPAFDELQRLPADATLEATYAVYQDYVTIAYDPTEGLVRMEVMAADPKVAAAWATQLIAYAEEQVDALTQRLRADQMRDAQAGYVEAQEGLAASQRRLIELQERFKVLSSEAEVGLLTTQISALDSQLTQERLSLAQMEANPNPNAARMAPVKQRIETLEAEIAALRARMTEGQAGEISLAQVQSELLVAQADLQTRQLLLAQSLQSVETARIEANRQVRYLSVSVSPVPPDAPAYPRAFENTMVTMLILMGIYLMLSMTAAILREQVSA